MAPGQVVFSHKSWDDGAESPACTCQPKEVRWHRTPNPLQAPEPMSHHLPSGSRAPCGLRLLSSVPSSPHGYPSALVWVAVTLRTERVMFCGHPSVWVPLVLCLGWG